MTQTSLHPEPLVELELREAVRELQSLGASLAQSYRALEVHAQRVEQELARANRELEAVLAALPTGVIVRDAEGRIVRTNSAALEVLGVREGELAGASVTALDSFEPIGDEWNEREFVRADGRRLVVARRRSQVRAPSLGSVEILDDRTRLAEFAERLHGLDKLAALGNMAGGIAHELRNPMTAVQGFAALLASKLPPGSEERRWAGLIVDGADESNSILTSMLSLAAPEKLVLATVDGCELARSAARLALHGEHYDSSAWSITHSIDVPPFAGDRIKLRQALRNLIANAIQAQPGGGAVRVELLREQDDLVARVSDGGPGIPSELRSRALEPFFTTRAEGTGLGLALVQRIAELHGGRVEISPLKSVLGGAEVSLRIPYRSPNP